MTSTLTDLAGNPVLSVVKEAVVSSDSSVAIPISRLTDQELEEKKILLDKIRLLVGNMQSSYESSQTVFNRYVDLRLKEIGLYEILEKNSIYYRFKGKLDNRNVHYLGYSFTLLFYSDLERYYKDSSGANATFSIYELGMNCSSCVIYNVECQPLLYMSETITEDAQSNIIKMLLDLAEHLAALCRYTTVMYTTSSSTRSLLEEYIQSSYKQIHSFINRRNSHGIKYYVKELE